MLEALFVVFFTTVIMLCFVQICIIVVDDMTANEAAFVAARSAAVTPRYKRKTVAEEKALNYLRYYSFTPESFANIMPSDKATVEQFFTRRSGSAQDEDEVLDESGGGSKNFLTLWVPQNAANKRSDYLGHSMTKSTVKIYYYTRVMFRSLVAWFNYKKDPLGGNKRFQSARNRFVGSPDVLYYYKAYPGAKKFDEE